MDSPQEEMPDSVVNLFERELPGGVSVRKKGVGRGIRITITDDSLPPEPGFIRPIGRKCIQQTGYAVTGARVSQQGGLVVWFDPIREDESVQLTVAQQAARILREQNERASFEANISDEPKEQYVDVFPDPVDAASMDWSIREETMERLRSEGLELRTMSMGRERGRYTDGENYRVWFVASGESDHREDAP